MASELLPKPREIRVAVPRRSGPRGAHPLLGRRRRRRPQRDRSAAEVEQQPASQANVALAIWGPHRSRLRHAVPLAAASVDGLPAPIVVTLGRRRGVAQSGRALGLGPRGFAGSNPAAPIRSVIRDQPCSFARHPRTEISGAWDGTARLACVRDPCRPSSPIDLFDVEKDLVAARSRAFDNGARSEAGDGRGGERCVPSRCLFARAHEPDYSLAWTTVVRRQCSHSADPCTMPAWRPARSHSRSEMREPHLECARAPRSRRPIRLTLTRHIPVNVSRVIAEPPAPAGTIAAWIA
jgi:hypothetical protein